MPKNKPLKLIIDTNLWVSFIISNKLNILDPLLNSEKIRILFSEELISEIRQTISKPKLRKYFSPDTFNEMLVVFDPYIDFVQLKVLLMFAEILATISCSPLLKMAEQIIY